METKDQILHTATLLIQTCGYLWSYEDISKALAIKKASIHYHFPTKESLILECVRSYIDKAWKAIELLSKESKQLDKIKKFIGIYQQAFKTKDAICLCTMLSANSNKSNVEINGLLNDFYQHMQAWLTAVFNEGLAQKEFELFAPSDVSSRILLNYLQGLLLTERLAGTEPDEYNRKSLAILSVLKKS